MSRLTQRLGAGVGITACIGFARPFESGLTLRVRPVLGTFHRAGRRLMMKLSADGLISSWCSRTSRRRSCCRLIDLLLRGRNLACARPSLRARGARQECYGCQYRDAESPQHHLPAFAWTKTRADPRWFHR
jgi:hypothetical protein